MLYKCLARNCPWFSVKSSTWLTIICFDGRAWRYVHRSLWKILSRTETTRCVKRYIALRHQRKRQGSFGYNSSIMIVCVQLELTSRQAWANDRTKIVHKNVNTVEFHYYIRDQYDKCIQMSTNMLRIGAVIHESWNFGILRHEIVQPITTWPSVKLFIL